MATFNQQGQTVENQHSTDLGEAIDRAARFLPEGYTVNIQIEKGGYNVELQRPDGEVSNIDGGGLVSDIDEAIHIAKEMMDWAKNH